MRDQSGRLPHLSQSHVKSGNKGKRVLVLLSYETVLCFITVLFFPLVFDGLDQTDFDVWL